MHLLLIIIYQIIKKQEIEFLVVRCESRERYILLHRSNLLADQAPQKNNQKADFLKIIGHILGADTLVITSSYLTVQKAGNMKLLENLTRKQNKTKNTVLLRFASNIRRKWFCTDCICFVVISSCQNVRTGRVDSFKFGIIKAPGTTACALGQAHHNPVRRTVLLYHKAAGLLRGLPGLADPPVTSFLGSGTFWLPGLIHLRAHKGCFRSTGMVPVIPLPPAGRKLVSKGQFPV